MKSNRRGTILVIALTTLLVVTLVAGAVLRGYLQSYRQLRREQDQLQAQWLADSALDRAASRLGADPKYAGETWKVELPSSTGDVTLGNVTITVESEPDQPESRRIAVAARFPDEDYRRTIAERTLTVSKPPTPDN